MEFLHHQYDRDEGRLLATAAQDLWASDLLDEVIDVCSPVLSKAEWHGVPEGRSRAWANRSTAILSLIAMGLRQTRIIALSVRAGYAPEAQGPYRRLQEAAGHAQQVARDPTDQYALNWMHGRGKADKPSVAFGGGKGGGPLWEFMSGQVHANFKHYANLSAGIQDRTGLQHRINPARDPVWDNVTLWHTARRLIIILAALHQVHDDIDQADLLIVGAKVVESEDRSADEFAAASDAKLEALLRDAAA